MISTPALDGVPGKLSDADGVLAADASSAPAPPLTKFKLNLGQFLFVFMCPS